METIDFDELLVAEIQKYPILYSSTSGKSKMSKRMREKAWAIIGNALRTQAELCSRRWILLRDRYVRELKHKEMNEKNGISAADLRSRWPLFPSLDFLRIHIKHRKSSSAIWEACNENLITSLCNEENSHTNENSSTSVSSQPVHSSLFDEQLSMESSRSSLSDANGGRARMEQDTARKRKKECSPSPERDLLALLRKKQTRGELFGAGLAPSFDLVPKEKWLEFQGRLTKFVDDLLKEYNCY